MKQSILSLLFIGCYAYAGPDTQEGFDKDLALHHFKHLCKLAKKSDTVESFQQLQAEIEGKYKKEEVIKLYDQLQEHLPHDAAWKIYTAVYDAEHPNNAQSPYQSHPKPTSAQLWQKCLSITITELHDNIDILNSKKLIQGAIAKLIDIKVRADAAQQAQSPR